MTAGHAGGFFDAEAAWYDAEYDGNTTSGRVLLARVEAVLSVLGTTPGSVLDAGMGGGRLCAELDRLGWRVTGVDASAAMVELARTRLPHLASQLLEGRIESLPVEGSSMDAVVATGVLEYVDDLGRAVRELARVLRVGGVAALSIPDPSSPNTVWRLRVVYPLARVAKAAIPFGRNAPPARPALSRSALETALDAAGMTVESVHRVGARPTPGRYRTRQLVYAARKRG